MSMVCAGPLTITYATSLMIRKYWTTTHLSFCWSCTGTLTPKYSHARPLLTDLHWLPVDQRINFKTALNMFKTVSNTFPFYISDTLDLLSKPKREGLRSQSNLVVPRSSMKFGDRAFSIAGPRIWKSLPTNIRNASSV